MDGSRAWSAVFDSYDPRTHDLYYIVTVLRDGTPETRFVAAVVPLWDPECWDDPRHAPRLLQALGEAAAAGRTHTAYQGTHMAWRRAGGPLPPAGDIGIQDHPVAYRYGSAAECEICARLRDLERGSVRESDNDIVLPPAACRLASVPGAWKNSLQKCPLCGTYYEYFHWFEYSPTGNEEEARLRRLPAAEALARLIEEELYPELQNLARRHAAGAEMVLRAIERSKLKRDSEPFKALQGLCRAIGRGQSG
jgi:hypothetical protein